VAGRYWSATRDPLGLQHVMKTAKNTEFTFSGKIQGK
jgi:hypothetical protein